MRYMQSYFFQNFGFYKNVARIIHIDMQNSDGRGLVPKSLSYWVIGQRGDGGRVLVFGKIRVASISNQKADLRMKP